MILVQPDYQGAVGSPAPSIFADMLCMLFGGEVNHSDSTQQSTWTLTGVGKWKICSSMDPTNHIPLRVEFPITELEDKIQSGLAEGLSYEIEGQDHWRLITLRSGGVCVGMIHFANRD